MMQGLAASSAALTAQGPVVNAELHPPPALLQLSPGTVFAVQAGLALVDTGASATVVDEAALRALGVQPVGVTRVQTPSGSEEQLVYPAELAFPGNNLPRTTFAMVIGSPHLAVQGLLALIGRDVLQRALLIYNGPSGVFTLAFNP
jgi:predicted aspartyl protease